MTMPNVAFLHPRAGAGVPAACAANPFWHAGIGSGAAAIAELASHVDVLSRRIAQLQPRMASARPVVGHYLDMVRTLAAAWHGRSRPALQVALEDGRPEVARALDTLAQPMLALEAVDADVRGALAQMAGATRDLETDTVLVTQRLQADQVHAFILSQQANAMQAKLDDARLKQRAAWLLGPRAEQIRKEMALHGTALDGMRRQLEHLRADQAALMAEAARRQELLPVLSTYLDAVDRMGAAIHALLAGAQGVQMALEQLRDGAGLAQAGARLPAALPSWAALPRPLQPD
ncbi:MAG: hypothetical protein V4633_18770 [Pseudomonadota bacterium]